MRHNGTHDQNLSTEPYEYEVGMLRTIPRSPGRLLLRKVHTYEEKVLKI